MLNGYVYIFAILTTIIILTYFNPQNTFILLTCVQYVEEYKLCVRRANNSMGTSDSSNPPTTKTNDVFMIMFEFEALNRLNDPRTEAVFERAIAMPHPQPKLFHNLAGE